MPDIFDRFAIELHHALDQLEAAGTLPSGAARAGVTVEPSRDSSHGDLATNAAMSLSKAAGLKPRELAMEIAPKLARVPWIQSAEVAGPGFINVALAPQAWDQELRTILSAGERFGFADAPSGRHVNVEYVSANPTGPMHMGHCRGAVVGDALAAVLEAAGDRVTREYYVNDAGAQVDVLARSVHVRYREALGEPVTISEGLYPGEYLKPVGAALAAEYGDRFAAAPETEWLATFRKRAVAAMMDMIRDDLAAIGIHHDRFVSEAALQAAHAPERTEAELRAKGLVYEGVLEPPKGELPDDWEPTELTLFRSTAFGDDVDRPLRKSTGAWTYFGADIAYHAEKASRSDALVNIWGADHSGTVKRIVAAVQALTDGRVKLDVKLVSLVHLFRNGEPVRMSKRAGNFVTLREVVDEVGRDVVRFIMLTRRAEAPLDFDFAKIVEQSKDNPVFYVQYAHARIRSLARRAAEAGIVPSRGEGDGSPDLSRLDDDERALIRVAAQFPRIVRGAAATREPHRIAFFLSELASAFHAIWNRGNDDPAKRFLIADDPALTAARLALADGVAQVIRNGLKLMGVTAVEEMR
ncbi:MAG: arginine--tRNA ligase [Sphingomonadaceae bacterium]|nr:arginine--tRNA ligase [Sphingomonadaceae bacterium]